MNDRTFTFTEEEFDIIARALVHLNDYENDTMLENVDELFPKTDNPVILNVETAKHVREELHDIVTRMIARHRLIRMFGGEVDPAGFSR